MLILASTSLKHRFVSVPLRRGNLYPSSSWWLTSRPRLAKPRIQQLATVSSKSSRPDDTEARHLKLELVALNQDKWGWVLYRCTYDKELHGAWNQFKTLFKAQSREDFEDCDTPEIAQSLEWTFVEDKETLNGATPIDLRSRFREWAEPAEQSENPRFKPLALGHLPSSRYRYFVHIDEQALRSFLNPDVASMSMEHGWVNLVDSMWESMEDEEPEEPLYGCTDENVGWMRVPGWSLNHAFYDVLGSLPESWHREYVRPPGLCRGF